MLPPPILLVNWDGTLEVSMARLVRALAGLVGWCHAWVQSQAGAIHYIIELYSTVEV